MATVSLTANHKQLLKKIAENHGIKNYKIVENEANDCDGYLSQMKFVSLYNLDENNQKLDIVLKLSLNSANLRKQFPARNFFMKEVYMYEKVFPEFISFQNAYKIPTPFNAIAKEYGSIWEEFDETIALENLKENGYKLCNRREPMDTEHLSLVVTEYARFHAVSFAMKHLQPEKFNKLTESMKFHTILEFLKTNFKNDSNFVVPSRLGSAIEALENKPKYVAALENFEKNFYSLMESKKDDNGHYVISHADCWSMNMLFKYEDKDHSRLPTKVCLIDWQLSHLNHPVNDLSYFLYICAGKHDLNNYTRYLQLYYTTLNDNLAGFGLDFKKIYPYEAFQTDWKEYSRLGLSSTLMLLQQTLHDKKMPTFEDLADQGENIIEPKWRQLPVTDLYKQRLTDLVDFLIKNEFI